MPALRLCITGLVQGVFYRSETQDKARALDLTGWVKNMPDGSVHIHAEGAPDALQKLGEWCKRGPQRARVESVTTEEVSEVGHRDFAIAS